MKEWDLKVGHFKDVGYKFNQWLDVGFWQIMLNDPETWNSSSSQKEKH